MTKTAITNKIRRLRFDHGEMTQQELAERIGVSRKTINTIENGVFVPSTVLALKLAKAFDTNVEALFALGD